MALINTIIPPSSFEVVRDLIASILNEEITNQAALDTSNIALQNMTFYIERFVTIDNTNFPAINVTFDREALSNQHQGQSDGEATYNIDCYQRAKASEDGLGDKKAMLQAQNVLGKCRAILEDPQYKKLGLEIPLIMNRHAESIEVGVQNASAETDNLVVGRMTFIVRVPEGSDLITKELIGELKTKVLLFDEDNGFQYEDIY